MPTLAAVVVPVRPDLAGFPQATRAQLENAFRQVTPSVRAGAKKHGEVFGSTMGAGIGNTLSQHLGPALGGMTSEFSAFSGAALGPLGAVTAGIGLLAGQAVNMGVRTAASMEQAQIGFETLLGSEKAAGTFLRDLQTFAAQTPFELPGLIESSRTLLGVGLSADQTKAALLAFGNASSAVGVGQENFQRVMIALSQSIGTGRFQTEELNQVTENGIPIWTILSRAMGKPVPELRALAQHGKLLTANVLPLLEKQMNKDYGGAMERQSRSLSGVWSTFMDTLNIGMANVMRPLIPLMTTGLTAATNVFSAALSAIPRAFSNTTAAGQQFTALIRGIASWVTGDLVPAFQQVAARVLPQVRAAMQSVGQAFSQHQDVIQALGAVLQGLGWVITRILVPALGIIVVMLVQQVATAINILLGVAGAVVGAIRAMNNFGAAVNSGITSAVTGAGRAMTDFGTAINNGITGAVTGAVRTMSNFGAAINTAVTSGLRSAGSWLVGIGASILNGLITGWNTVAPHLAIAAGHTRDGILIAFRAAGSWLTGAGRAILQGLINGYNTLIAPWLNVVTGFISRYVIAPMVRSITWWVNAGRNIITGLINGARALFGAVSSTVSGFIARYIIAPMSRSLTWWLGPGRNIITGLLNGARSLFGAVTSTIAGFISQRIIRPFAGAITWLVGGGRNAISGLINGMSAVGRTINGFVQSRIINPIASRFTGAIGWLRAAGGQVVSGLLGGISTAIANVRNWVSAHIVNPIINAVKYFFGIKSPSTVMAGIGGNIIAGLIQGLVRTNPVQLIGKIFGGMPSALGAIVNKGLVSITSLPGKALSALGGLAGKVGGIVGGLFGGGRLIGGGSPGGAGGAARWSGVVLQALSMLGQSASWLPTVLSRMNRESGGNPRAINLWDVNAQRGDPSRGLMQTIGCVTVDTVILTRRGWLKHDEVQVGDETIGYNPVTELAEWTPITAVHHYDDADVWRIGNNHWKVDVTPNHRWWSDTRTVRSPEALTVCPECGWTGRTDRAARAKAITTTPRSVSTHRGRAHGAKDEPTLTYVGEFVRTDQLSSDHRIRVAARADTGTTLDLTPTEAALIGWALGDGTISRDGDISLWQSKPQGVAEIQRLLEGVPHGTSIRQRKAHYLPAYSFRLRREYARSLLARSQVRELGPEGFVLALDAEQRAAFLKAMIDAEGHTANGFTRIVQVNGPVQEAIKLAVYLEGYRPTFSANSAERNGYQPAGAVGMARPHVAPGMFAEPEVLPRQAVWCVTTRLGTWTAEQDGLPFMTGNSTFAAYAGPLRGRGIYDPLANVYAGLNYALHRYGSLAALNRPGGYDAGGWLPPGGVGMNLTGRPERVLDPQQSEAYSRGGGLGGNVRVVVMMDGSVIDDRVHVIVEDAVGELGARISNGIGG